MITRILTILLVASSAFGQWKLGGDTQENARVDYLIVNDSLRLDGDFNVGSADSVANVTVFGYIKSSLAISDSFSINEEYTTPFPASISGLLFIGVNEDRFALIHMYNKSTLVSMNGGPNISTYKGFSNCVNIYVEDGFVCIQNKYQEGCSVNVGYIGL